MEEVILEHDLEFLLSELNKQSQENPNNVGMIIDDESLDQIINDFHYSQKKIFPDTEELNHPLGLLHAMINLKKENLLFSKKVNLLNKLVRNKRSERIMTNYIKNDFIGETILKDNYTTNMLNINYHDAINEFYPITEKIGKNNFKTEKKNKKKRINKNSTKSAI